MDMPELKIPDMKREIRVVWILVASAAGSWKRQRPSIEIARAIWLPQMSDIGPEMTLSPRIQSDTDSLDTVKLVPNSETSAGPAGAKMLLPKLTMKTNKEVEKVMRDFLPKDQFRGHSLSLMPSQLTITDASECVTITSSLLLLMHR